MEGTGLDSCDLSLPGCEPGTFSFWRPVDLRWSEEVGCVMVAQMALRWMSAHLDVAEGEVELVGRESRSEQGEIDHMTVRIPQCACCSSPSHLTSSGHSQRRSLNLVMQHILRETITSHPKM